jgi:hypothetical protein
MSTQLTREDRLVNVLYDTVEARKAEIRRTAYGRNILESIDLLLERGWTDFDMNKFEANIIGSLQGEHQNSRVRALLAVWRAYANWKAVV